MIKWIKKGLIFNVENNIGWMNTHAQVPTVLVLKDRFRVYFSTRSIQTESKITFVDLDIDNPKKILYLHNEPILQSGVAGAFDEHGVMPASVLEFNGRIYLYYSGWSRRYEVPYSNLTGIAVSTDGGVTFKRLGDGPILSLNLNEPYSATSPYVYNENNKFHMFYCSGTKWLLLNNKYEHVYDIKYAVSENGIDFVQNGRTVINSYDDQALTRPVIIKKFGLYHMWFCYRGSSDFRDGKNSYRIGYATSHDLINWERNDMEGGLEVSENGWDSRMVAYPFVVETASGVFMFYNGNGFGKSGFGYAVMDVRN